MSVALHALFILIPSEKPPLMVMCVLPTWNFVCFVLNAITVRYQVYALMCPWERNGHIWDLLVIRPNPHGRHMRRKPSILKVPMISVACKELMRDGHLCHFAHTKAQYYCSNSAWRRAVVSDMRASVQHKAEKYRQKRKCGWCFLVMWIPGLFLWMWMAIASVVNCVLSVH